jgi:CysZ protein
MGATRQVIGFWRGFSALFGALRSLLSMPKAWPYALVPMLVFMALEASFVAAAWLWLKPWVGEQVAGDGTVREIGATAAAWGALLLSAALGWLLSAFFAPTLSAPALERIVALVEVELGAPPREGLSVLGEFWCGLRSLFVCSAITLPLVLGLTLLELVVPPTAVVATPLKLLIGALGIAWGLFDYPLTLRGVGARQRLAFMSANAGPVLGFGVAFALVFWLPCAGILMLPVGVIAATRLYWTIERAQ